MWEFTQARVGFFYILFFDSLLALTRPFVIFGTWSDCSRGHGYMFFFCVEKQ